MTEHHQRMGNVMSQSERRRRRKAMAGAKPLHSPPGGKTTALFIKGQHLLTISGDASDNEIRVGRDSAGLITINDGDIDIRGAKATVANVNRIVIFGGSGNDRLAIDDSNGPMPAASIFGQSGDDELFGGSGNDTLVGGTDSDR